MLPTNTQTNKPTAIRRRRKRVGGGGRRRNKTIQYRHEINATKLNFSKSKRRAIRSVSCCSSNGRRGTGETESHSKQTNRIKRKKPKKKKMNKVNKQTNKQIDRQTNQQTDQPTGPNQLKRLIRLRFIESHGGQKAAFRLFHYGGVLSNFFRYC